jgi:hypothetical protein
MKGRGKLVKSFICIAAAAGLLTTGLIGCQGDNSKSDTNTYPSSGQSTSSAYNVSGRSAGEAGGTSAGVPDQPGASSAVAPNQPDQNRYGSQNRTGTLSGGTTGTPDANTMGGGR